MVASMSISRDRRAAGGEMCVACAVSKRGIFWLAGRMPVSRSISCARVCCLESFFSCLIYWLFFSWFWTRSFVSLGSWAWATADNGFSHRPVSRTSFVLFPVPSVPQKMSPSSTFAGSVAVSRYWRHRPSGCPRSRLCGLITTASRPAGGRRHSRTPGPGPQK